jgi:agmatinase
MKFSGSLSEVDKEKAWFEIIGVPFDSNASKTGTREGPQAIRRASQRLETFLWDRKLELSDVLYYDCGDIPLERSITGESHTEFDLTRKKVFIGGNHSISYPLVKHLFEHGEVANVIVIDAHADLRDSYKGNRFSNACAVRRIAELIGFEHVTEIGVRSSSEEEYWLLKEKIKLCDAEMLRERGVEGVLNELEGEAVGKTYLSIDIDALDPSIAPGVEHPEPCGMSLETMISLIHGIVKKDNVVACDVVEVNPKLDIVNGITSINAARLVCEIVACYGDTLEEGY